MNFNLITYLPGLVLFFAVFTFIVIGIEKKFFAFVKTYWFYKRSIFSYLSTFFFLVGMGLLLTSLLDLRGAEEKIKVDTNRTQKFLKRFLLFNFQGLESEFIFEPKASVDGILFHGNTFI